MNETDFIRNRRSVRRYTPDPVPLEVVEDILDCARMAPTAQNNQPWLVGAVMDRTLLSLLADLVSNARFIQESGVCFAVFAKRAQIHYLEDGCAATMNIIYAAQAHGIATCWVAGDKKKYAERVRELLVVPAAYTLVALVVAGYPAKVPEPTKKNPERLLFRNNYQGTPEGGPEPPSRPVSILKKFRWGVRRMMLGSSRK